MTWKSFHVIVWPLSASLLGASWMLNRATVADARSTNASLQQSIDRVLATQQILLQRAVSGGVTQTQTLGIVDEFQTPTLSTDEFASLMGCNADTVRRRQKRGDADYQDFELVGQRMRWTNPQARIGLESGRL